MRSGEVKILEAGSGRRNSLFGQMGGQTLRRDIDQRRRHESYSDFPSSGLFEKTFSFFKSYDLIFRIAVGHSKHLLFEATQVSFASLFFASTPSCCRCLYLCAFMPEQRAKSLVSPSPPPPFLFLCGNPIFPLRFIANLAVNLLRPPPPPSAKKIALC